MRITRLICDKEFYSVTLLASKRSISFTGSISILSIIFISDNFLSEAKKDISIRV